MPARTRVAAIVALVAAGVAGAVVGVTLLQTRGESTGTTARPGAPPLYLVVSGPLGRAVRLYDTGRRKEAAAVFARYGSLPALIGTAFASWPHGTLGAMKKLVVAHPRNAVAELHLGLAYYWSGQDIDAAASWTRAAALQPDTPTAITALDFLHPGVAPGLPPIVADLAQVQANARAFLARGIELWDRERPVSARRELAQAAARAPHDPTVLTAAAVSTFSPANPMAPFPALGPLSGRFPKAAVVRFHLGELLLWTKQVKKGKEQLRLAASVQPGSAYARAAEEILAALPRAGTG